jgi:hypothetical protein
MVSSGMLRSVALVSSSETSVLTRATRRNIPEDTILQTTEVFSYREKLYEKMKIVCLDPDSEGQSDRLQKPALIRQAVIAT